MAKDRNKTSHFFEKWINMKSLIIVLVISLLGNAYLYINSFENRDLTSLSKYPYLTKDVLETAPKDLIINFNPVRKAIKDFIGNNPNIGVYFEYLPSGVSVGVNEKDEVRLVSLAKVPLAMSIMKKVEKGGISLDDVITIKKSDIDERFGDLWKRGEGAQLTVKELLEISLQNSDNTAYNALFDLLTPQEVIDVYDNLEVEVTSIDSQPFISPKNFSSIFRSLYLSSYLTPADSNYILTTLTNTKFKDKIPAGVPKNIVVSHKVGVLNPADNQGMYTDCGIVYVPLRPYILCIFVKDTDSVATKDMSYISYMIYSYVSQIIGGNKVIIEPDTSSSTESILNQKD